MTHLEAWFAEAVQLQQAGNHAGASLAWRRLLSRHPDLMDGWINYAACLRRAGRMEDAKEALAKADALGPESPALLLERAEILLASGQPADALAAQLRAIALEPADPAGRFGLGRIYHRLGRGEEALAADEAALALAPDHPGALVNRSASLLRLQRTEEAVADASRAVALDPSNPLAHLNLGIALLQGGHLDAGFREYEWRWRVPDIAAFDPELGCPRWQGEPFAGRTLLLWAEQGLGDSLMALRYLPKVKGLGGRVILRLQPSLLRIARSVPVDLLIGEDEAPPPADLQAPLMSLPSLLGPEPIPPAPYLPMPAPELAPRRVEIDARLDAIPGRRIGLVWAGNAIHQDNAYRCLPLEALGGLARLKDITWVSLQRWEEGPPPLPELPLVDLGDLLSDFCDTAHALSRLDGLVTVDTSVVHLAGALGLPAHLILAKAPDWRWQLERSDSPWYPSVKIYRQPVDGDWKGAIAAVAAALEPR
ncbi:MAG: tetratricopeptide repeat protein [Acidobacteria bacterium]|nr:tetratricopeptide repeat protein [Acidobacteriota bacterium]